MAIEGIEIPLTVEETLVKLSVNEVHKITGKRSTWSTKASVVKKIHPERRFKLFEINGSVYVGRKKDSETN